MGWKYRFNLAHHLALIGSRDVPVKSSTFWPQALVGLFFDRAREFMCRYSDGLWTGLRLLGLLPGSIRC